MILLTLAVSFLRSSGNEFFCLLDYGSFWILLSGYYSLLYLIRTLGQDNLKTHLILRTVRKV